jgi:hypothetical protein
VWAGRARRITPVACAIDAVCSILKCSIGADTEIVPLLITVSAVRLPLILVSEVVLFVPDLIFGKDR